MRYRLKSRRRPALMPDPDPPFAAKPYAQDMRSPSSVSTSDMPVAKRSGRRSVAAGGMPWDGLMPASARSAISLLVSKPRPKRKPSSSIFHSLSMVFSSPPQHRTKRPPCECSPAPSPLRVWAHEPLRLMRLAVPMAKSTTALTIWLTSSPTPFAALKCSCGESDGGLGGGLSGNEQEQWWLRWRVGRRR